jgi:hypothetical protein
LGIIIQSLIDLAGSEKATSDKERTREGKYINTSLLTLGSVIGTLAENAAKNKKSEASSYAMLGILKLSFSATTYLIVIPSLHDCSSLHYQEMPESRSYVPSIPTPMPWQKARVRFCSLRGLNEYKFVVFFLSVATSMLIPRAPSLTQKRKRLSILML